MFSPPTASTSPGCPTAPDSPRRSWDLAKTTREVAVSAILGVGVLFLIFVGHPEAFGWRVVAYGALNGLSIFAFCRLLHASLGEPILRREIIPRPAVLAAIFFLGGVLGWGLTTLITQGIGLTRFHFTVQDLRISFAIAGSIAIILGLSFYSFARLEERLRASVARLKEAEFAEKELELARAIQSRLLPPPLVEGDGYRVTARNLAARFVAGDFYDVFPPGEGVIGLVIADVSGKGIGSSLIMASVKAVVPLVAVDSSAAEVLTRLNQKLSDELSPREFVALCFARCDAARGSIEIANAGLPDPYILSAGGRIETLSVPGPRLPLGARREVTYSSLRVTISIGDRVLFLTDGLPEASSASGEPLGYERLSSLVESAATAEDGMLDRLLESVHAETTEPIEDDWTVLLYERRP